MKILKSLMEAVSKRCFAGKLPDSYLVVDLETSGFPGSTNPNGLPACIVQFGLASVTNRHLVHNDAFYINRPLGTMQLQATQVNGITDDMLATAMPAEQFYGIIIKLFKEIIAKDHAIVGHNVICFDGPFLRSDIKQAGYDFDLNVKQYIDTGMIFKAAQIGVMPTEKETLDGFFRRVVAIHSRAKWNLPYTMQELGLTERLKLDLAKGHDAGFDCYMTHLLLEELRTLAMRE
jgi:DNA polymerase III epsilon subunit-like protein